MPPRQGLNATLSYPRGGAVRGFRLRVNEINHGVKATYEESQADLTRALYPHRLSMAQFVIKVQCKGYEERKRLSDWLSVYAYFVSSSDSTFPEMTVSVPSRNFWRRGVPLGPFEFGDHVGSMLFEPTITFETTGEPWDHNRPAGSTVKDANNVTGRNESRYFYPTGIQLSGTAAPPDGTYATVVNANDALLNDFIINNDPTQGYDPNQAVGPAEGR